MRTHHEYGAYCVPIPAPADARLFSLKVETIALEGGGQRRFVDAILLDGDRISVLPFIRVASDGSLTLQECYANLPEDLLSVLFTQTRNWLAAKGEDAVLDATTFLVDAQIEEALLTSETTGRALAGLVPYDMLFLEAERYANMTPFVRGKRVVDLNGGFGYGAHSLGRVARSVDVRAANAHAIAQRMWRNDARGGEIALHLGVEGEIGQALERARDLVPSAETILLSVKGNEGEDELRDAGAEIVKMRRPGCDALGDLDETLGIVRAGSSVHVTVPDIPESARAAQVSPRPLRVLFALRPSAQVAFGGDVVQVRETAQALRARGHFVEVSTSPQLQPDGFDIVHLSNLTSVAETLAQSQSVAAFDGAVAMMPIYIDHADETMWGMTTSLSIFLSAESDEDLTGKLASLERRQITVADLRPPPARMQMLPEYDTLQRRILENVDFLIANADAEVHRIYRYLDCSIPYQVAPSAADPRLYGPLARKAFEAKYGLRDFVLIAGRYEPRKNQLLLFEALRGLGYPLVSIGSNAETPVAHALRAYRPADGVYIGFLPEVELAGAFAAARVVAIPSWDEVVSLTSLNAAISEASLVLTRNSYEHEYFRDDAEYCDPGSVVSLRNALRRAWETHERRAERRRDLAERVMREYSWEQSAQATEAAYYRLLQDNPRRRQRLAKAVRESISIGG